MKKILLVAILALGILVMAACEKDRPQIPGDSMNQQTPTGGSTISVYDMDMKLVGKFQYQNATDNTMDMTQFAKTGYKIDGIFDMNRDVMLFNANGNQAPTVMLDMDFTAVIKYSPMTYQLVFDAGEGELDNAVEYTKMISYEEAVGLFPKTVLQGKELDGWFDAAGNRYSNGITPVAPKFTAEDYALNGEVITLYAHYKVKYCDVRLMMQDGSSDIRLQVEYGQMLPDLTQYLKDDGQKAIMGFGVSPNASAVFEDAVYTDLDLYALWREYKYVNFVYSETETKVVKVFREGNICTLPEGKWPGYEFEGWYSSALLSGNKITTISFEGMQDVYYGKWSVGSYTIQFVADGVLVGIYTYDVYNTDIPVPPVPDKANHTGMWENYTLAFTNMVVNAVYAPNEVKVTLMNGYEYSYQTATYGQNFVWPVATKTGFNFTGWYYKGQQLTDADGNSLAAYLFDGPITVTAGWEAKFCKLYFETNGGDALDTVSVQYGQPYDLTQKPVRSGYHFSGWYDESMTQEYVGGISLTSDTVVYAKWVKSTAIATVNDLKKIADNPAGNYHLTADIDLKGGDWAPIENFSGILDGNGHKIHNFSLRQNAASLGFIINNSGIIKNITFSNVDISSTVEGGGNYAYGIACAFNTGRVSNVKVEKISALVNVSGRNVYHNIRLGGLVGENSGVIISCTSQGEMMFKTDVGNYGYGTSSSAELFVGGAVGKDLGTTTGVTTNIFMDINEQVVTDCYIGDCYEHAYLNIGGVVGGEYGTLTDCSAVVDFKLYSNAGGDSQSLRYSRIGGVVGGCYETSSVARCYSQGQIAFKRIGRLSGTEMGIGGVVGYMESGMLNNCASSANITLQEGHGGNTGGVVGVLKVNGKVSNVVYYGTICTETFNGGYFAGLAGKVEGWLTKGYFAGRLESTSTQTADIVGVIDASGSVSKTIGNGGTGKVFAAGTGSSVYNYLIGVDYEASALMDRELLFDVLGLFESDLWSTDEDAGLHLIAFPWNP